jgi:hypothetical protein
MEPGIACGNAVPNGAAFLSYRQSMQIGDIVIYAIG